MAALSLSEGKTEQAIGFLIKAAKHAVQFDTLPEKGKYISLLTNRLEYDVRNTSKKLFP